jgi:hypothetical protein
MFEKAGTLQFGRHTLADISKVIKLMPVLQKAWTRPVWFVHTIKGWKSPEDLAYDFYGNSEYVWVILLLNNIVDPFRDWLMTGEELERYAEWKYGIDGMQAPHHWTSLDGRLHNTLQPGAKAVTNWTYEYDENEKRRRVKLPIRTFLPSIIEAVDNAMEGKNVHQLLSGRLSPVD